MQTASTAVLGLTILLATAGTALAQPSAELKAKVVALQKVYRTGSGTDFEKAVEQFKSLGPAPLLQAALAEAYEGADTKAKVALLYALDQVGVEGAVKILPLIAADFAVARPKHPNDLSFAGFYVLEKFMLLAWKKLPAPPKDKGDKKEVQKLAHDKGPPTVEPVDEDKLTRIAPDMFTHTGSLKDRRAIREVVIDKKLHVWAEKKKTFPVPSAEDTDWVRVLASHAFVRLRGPSSGVDYLFVKKDGQWWWLAQLGHWIN